MNLDCLTQEELLARLEALRADMAVQRSIVMQGATQISERDRNMKIDVKFVAAQLRDYEDMERRTRLAWSLRDAAYDPPYPNVLDPRLLMLGPRAMFNRLMGKPAKAFVGGYNASRLGRRLQGWDAERCNINTLLMLGGDPLRARARQLCRENPYAANAVEAFVSSAVGAGIKPSSLLSDAAVKAEVQAAWLQWTDEDDADGLTDFYGLQALAARALFEAGECFIRFRPRRSEDGLSVPLQLQILEAEHLPFDHNEQASNGNVIRAGIEFDGIGRRVAHHFLRNHPGEAALNFAGLDKTVVPASEVMHLYRPLRPGQIRGQPAVVPGMIRLYLLDQYDDAEVDRKRVAAMFAGFVTKPQPEDGSPVPLDP